VVKDVSEARQFGPTPDDVFWVGFGHQAKIPQHPEGGLSGFVFVIGSPQPVMKKLIYDQ